MASIREANSRSAQGNIDHGVQVCPGDGMPVKRPEFSLPGKGPAYV